jgi:hypothetical protein
MKAKNNNDDNISADRAQSVMSSPTPSPMDLGFNDSQKNLEMQDMKNIIK